MSELVVKLGNSGSEIREMLVQVYEDNAVNKTVVHKWMTPTIAVLAVLSQFQRVKEVKLSLCLSN
jgi:hypothetical protein